MKTIAVLLAIVVVTSAAPRQPSGRQLRQARQPAISAEVAQHREVQSSSLEQESDQSQQIDQSQQTSSESQAFTQAQVQTQQEPLVQSRQQRQYRPQQGQQNLKAPSQLQQEKQFSQQPEVVLLKETPNNNVGLDGYQYAYELSDGTRREETAQVVDARAASAPGEEPTAILRVRGSYSYVDPYDGKNYTVTYIADENGFQPQGEHIPSRPSP